MGTELFSARVKDENLDMPAVPPGFESFTSFTSKKVEDKSTVISCSEYANASGSQSAQLVAKLDIGDAAKLTRSLRRKPWINHGHYNNCSEDECEVDQLHQNLPVRPGLPKGVIRGCPECTNCQKVVARWRPEDACRPAVVDAPAFYPTEEEFEDTLNYIASIRPKAEQYGICRIVPPLSWKPPCPLKEKSIWECSKFATRVQRIDKLQNRNSMRKVSKIQNHMRKKRRKCMKMEVDCGVGSVNTLGPGDAGFNEAERFGFEPGPDFTLDTFQKYADDFKAQYFSKHEPVRDMGVSLSTHNEQWEPSLEIIEGEYWRMVEKPSEEIEVLYGADLETGNFGSGFPKTSNQVGSASDEKYIKSGWNLNNFPRLPGSVLSYESSDISGVLVPWLYIGMCFSSFCWHVEDHHLYSLNYMHWGAPKMWYGVPACDALKLEAAMRKHLPDLFEEQPDLLHKLVTQLSPSILKSEGVPVYRCVQNPGEFVLTFPRAYHSGFNSGFNCAEAVNVAPVDWLPHGQNAIELYCVQGRRTSISHDKLLLGAAREAVKAHWELNLLKKNSADNLRWKAVCGKEGILAKAFKMRVDLERTRREFLCSSSSQAMKMDSNFDATSERECTICLFDLHLSAAGCYCSPDKYACLNHAKQLCECAWSDKYFLFRYNVNELDILVEALEGKLSAIYRWARLDLGLALSSFVSKDKIQFPGPTDQFTNFSEGKSVKDVNPQQSVSLNGLGGKEGPISLAGIVNDITPQQLENPLTAVLALEAAPPCNRSVLETKISNNSSLIKKEESVHPSNRSVLETKISNNSSLIKKEESVHPNSNLNLLCCQISKEDTSYAEITDIKKSEIRKEAVSGLDNVILLSDDEGEEPMKPISTGMKETSSRKHSEVSKNMTVSDVQRNPVSNPVSDATTREGNVGCSSHIGQATDELNNKGGVVLGSNISCQLSSIGANCDKNVNNVLASIETSDCNVAKVGSGPQLPQTGKPHNEDKREKIETNANSHVINNARTATGQPSCIVNNVNKSFRQGPRIAKVVRRINCNVELLEFGVVLSGKSWCNNQAIFPKGFRSRARYMSVLDPSNMSYYVSEILDAGQDRPLFTVTLEHCPSEVFIHISAARCWEMVRDRVNQEISKQHKLGRTNLPPLQPPGSLDGFEMFGFSSPAIVQAIEALDRNRVCTEYWDSRPYSRPQVQITQSRDNAGRLNDREAAASRTHVLPNGVDTILGGLFKKANPEELNALYSILSNDKATADGNLVTRLLREEIHKRLR